MAKGDDWVRGVSSRIGGEVARLRGKQSAQWLADRCDELGLPIGRATISEIERGQRRSLSVAEVIVLAKALDTSPLSLIYPDPNDNVDVLPGEPGLALWAAEWFSGLFPGLITGDQAAAYRKNNRALTDARRIAHLERERPETVDRGRAEPRQTRTVTISDTVGRTPSAAGTAES